MKKPNLQGPRGFKLTQRDSWYQLQSVKGWN